MGLFVLGLLSYLSPAELSEFTVGGSESHTRIPRRSTGNQLSADMNDASIVSMIPTLYLPLITISVTVECGVAGD